MHPILIKLSAQRNKLTNCLRLTISAISLACTFLGCYGYAQRRQPDLVLRGTVTYADRRPTSSCHLLLATI
jgi:hypothetical protein